MAGTAMIGRTFSRYRIDDRLGAGGMGEVYRAHDQSLGRDVALKVLPEGMSSDPERLARFEREAKTLASLNHPNIVTIYEVGEADEVHFLAMEMVDGRTLAEIIPRGGLELERIFALAVPLADALAAAHDRGIVHRDLKPNNVMVTEDGRVKVLDFGLAKLRTRATPEGSTADPQESLTCEGALLGTLPYMSPEQVQGKDADQRSDVFSLGVVLYEMATGQRPFGGDTFADLASAILRDRPDDVDLVRSELPRDLGRVVRRCLEKDPERRFQSTKDVRNELQDLARELATEEIVRKAALERVPTERGRRHRLWVAGAVAVTLVVAVTIGRHVIVNRQPGGSAPGSDRIRSLAVLPFDNLMGDPEQEYFVQGMHEALITDLSKIGALRVISRTSAMRYQDTDKSIPEIARELDVDALIEGSVFRADGQVRITAQLIRGATDEHLWADNYDRDLENVLSLLSDVAQAIAREVAVTVTPEQQRRLAAAPAVGREIQDKLLQARFHVNRFTRSGFAKARELYREVVELEPTFAPGWAGLASVEFVHGFFGYEPLEDTMLRAEECANTAFELDPDSALALAIRGTVDLFWHWRWDRAWPSLVRAVELDPNNAFVRHALADYYMVIGDEENSVRQVREGARRDPMSMLALIPLAGHLSYAGQYDEAISEAERAIELFPDVWFFRMVRARTLWWRGSYEEAIRAYEEFFGEHTEHVQTIRNGYAHGGPAVAMRNLADFLAAEPDPDPLDVASHYAEAGESDLAFEWLEKAFDSRIPQLLHILGHPAYDSMRDDPRFRDLLRRMGMPVE